MTALDLAAIHDEAFALRLELGELSAALKRKAEHYEKVRMRLIALRSEISAGAQEEDEAEPASLAQLAMFG